MIYSGSAWNIAEPIFTGIAQLVEHWSPKPGVGSSSLSSRAKSIIMFKKFANYCKCCYDELAHKTTWPTRGELTHSAMVVLSASLVIAIVVFIMDSAFSFVMSTVYPN